MQLVIKIIGTAIVCLGLVYLIRPKTLRAIMRLFSVGNRLYLAAIVRFALAIIFFLGARECDLEKVIVLFGLIFIISGLLIFLLGIEKSKAIISWYQEQPIAIFRVVAIIVLSVGLIIVYSA